MKLILLKKPLENNTRHHANDLFNKHHDQEPWSIEQEYFIDKKTEKLDLLMIMIMECYKQGQYYCSAKSWKRYCKSTSTSHLNGIIYIGN